MNSSEIFLEKRPYENISESNDSLNQFVRSIEENLNLI
jgi:hypothetical protein